MFFMCMWRTGPVQAFHGLFGGRPKPGRRRHCEHHNATPPLGTNQGGSFILVFHWPRAFIARRGVLPIPEPSFAHLPPQRSAEVIGEACPLFSRFSHSELSSPLPQAGAQRRPSRRACSTRILPSFERTCCLRQHTRRSVLSFHRRACTRSSRLSSTVRARAAGPNACPSWVLSRKRGMIHTACIYGTTTGPHSDRTARRGAHMPVRLCRVPPSL
ncbi:hypothetical protein BJY52DRAFT_36019 [Lactarius psammicola]|nr:hypothetical protein BJY52DRAFT_36019 [Lactarius psammicola]